MASIKAGIVAVSAYLMLVLIAYKTSGYLVMSPSPRAAVCQAGDALEVTCTTSDHFLTWILTKSGSIYRITRTLSSTIRNPERVVVNSTVFTFSRMSELGSTDLVSKLVISPVSQGLNGTKIVCTEIGASAMMANTTVYIIRNEHVYHPKSPEIVVTKEDFRMDEVTISLEWLATQELTENLFESLASYNISVKPSERVKVVMIDARRANLTMPYNTLYNVSVTAIFCDRINTSMIIELYYANCGNPFYQNQLNNSNLQVAGNTNPALEGDSVIFSCSLGLEINGSNVSTCMGNGKWEPAPEEVECKEREVITEIVRTSTGNDGLLELMNLSHITITTDLNFSTRKNHHGVKNIIGFTMIGALIVAGFVALTILSIAVAVVKRPKDNDNQPLVSNIHLERVHFNQKLYEKEDHNYSN